MIKLIAGLLALTLVLTPYTVEVTVHASGVPAFPFAHYSDVIGVTPIGPACTSISEQVTELRAFGYRILSSKDRDVFIHESPEGLPDFVYFAKGTGEDDKVHVTRSLTIDEARAAYPTGPCAFFTERDV